MRPTLLAAAAAALTLAVPAHADPVTYVAAADDDGIAWCTLTHHSGTGTISAGAVSTRVPTAFAGVSCRVTDRLTGTTYTTGPEYLPGSAAWSSRSVSTDPDGDYEICVEASWPNGSVSDCT